MNMLALTFIFPLIGFLILAIARDRMCQKTAKIVGVGAMGLSVIAALVAGIQFLGTSREPYLFLCGRGLQWVILRPNLGLCSMGCR